MTIIDRHLAAHQIVHRHRLALEAKSPASDRAVGWIDKALLAMAGAAFMYVLKSLGVVP